MTSSDHPFCLFTRITSVRRVKCWDSVLLHKLWPGTEHSLHLLEVQLRMMLFLADGQGSAITSFYDKAFYSATSICIKLLHTPVKFRYTPKEETFLSAL